MATTATTTQIHRREREQGHRTASISHTSVKVHMPFLSRQDHIQEVEQDTSMHVCTCKGVCNDMCGRCVVQEITGLQCKKCVCAMCVACGRIVISRDTEMYVIWSEPHYDRHYMPYRHMCACQVQVSMRMRNVGPNSVFCAVFSCHSSIARDNSLIHAHTHTQPYIFMLPSVLLYFGIISRRKQA